MDPNSGELVQVVDEFEALEKGLVPVRRLLTPKEICDKQIQLYSPCACGSGKKFKFCCFGKNKKEEPQLLLEVTDLFPTLYKKERMAAAERDALAILETVVTEEVKSEVDKEPYVG